MKLKNFKIIYTINYTLSMILTGIMISYIIRDVSILVVLPIWAFFGLFGVIWGKIMDKKWGIELKKCKDTHCGSFNDCDKIHCHQFYEYTKDGIKKRD